jgi:hypothetical protein
MISEGFAGKLLGEGTHVYGTWTNGGIPNAESLAYR